MLIRQCILLKKKKFKNRHSSFCVSRLHDAAVHCSLFAFRSLFLIAPSKKETKTRKQSKVSATTGNILYTGISRARQLLVLVGSTDAVRRAVRSDAAARRNTLLAERVDDRRFAPPTTRHMLPT